MAYFIVGVQIETEFLFRANSTDDAQRQARAKIKAMFFNPDLRVLITKVKETKEDEPT